MAFTALDKRLILSGVLRSADPSQASDIVQVSFQFWELSAQEQEVRIRNEALLEYGEIQDRIARLQVELVSLQATAQTLLDRSNGIK